MCLAAHDWKFLRWTTPNTSNFYCLPGRTGGTPLVVSLHIQTYSRRDFKHTPEIKVARLDSMSSLCYSPLVPRRPRIHLPTLPLHIVKRGHNRDACFFAEEEYLAYQEWLAEACTATGCLLHAYVLMANRSWSSLPRPLSQL